MMARIAVGTAVGEAFRAVTPGWRAAWGALGLAALIAGAGQFGSGSQPGGNPLLVLTLSLLSLAAGTMVKGALYRLALAPDHPGDPAYQIGAAGVQWNGFEWRILGASLIVGLIVGAVMVVVFIVWAIVLGVMIAAHAIDPNAISQLQQGGASPGPALLSTFASAGGLISLLVLAAGMIGVLYLAARFSVAAISYAEKLQFNLGSAWSLTQGASVAIIVSWILIFVAAAIAGAVGGFFGGLASGVSGSHSGALWGSALGAVAGAAISGPAGAGLVSYVYRTQRGPSPDVAAVFS
jgi:hypothetical protein